MDFDVIGPAMLGMGVLGGLIMLALPEYFDGFKGWLFVSFVAIPGFLALVALAVSIPGIAVGLLFLAGVYATKR